MSTALSEKDHLSAPASNHHQQLCYSELMWFFCLFVLRREGILQTGKLYFCNFYQCHANQNKGSWDFGEANLEHCDLGKKRNAEMVLVVFMKKSLFWFGNVRPLALLRKAVENIIYFIVWELSCLYFPGSFFFSGCERSRFACHLC